MEKYQRRISGPLLDRLDLLIDVPRVPTELLTPTPPTEFSTDIQRRGAQARDRQRSRYANDGILVNSELHAGNLHDVCRLTANADALVRQATDRLRLSARGFT